MNPLTSAVNEYFEAIVAATPELLEEALRLRCQVYSREKGALEATPAGLETDSYDRYSTHGLVRHRASGSYIGAVRLISARPEASTTSAEGGSPTASVAHDIVPESLPVAAYAELPAGRIAELSRFLVLKPFRGLPGPKMPGTTATVLPPPILELFIAVAHMAAAHRYTHLCALMTPAMHRLLKHFGISFRAIGPVVDCHGLRRPYLCVVSEVLAELYETRIDLWILLTDNGKLWAAPNNGVTAPGLTPGAVEV